ncbi:MAG: hypothetical protein HZC40_03070 [Chloroflexi bacterium]|nr:hypothetical protein [Chloroflexota bacterium]
MVEKTVMVTNFFARHFIASLASILFPVILTVVAYFVLLVIAIFTNTGLGSPIALPLWMIIVAIFSTAYTALLLFPVALIAEIVSRVFGKWQHFAQVPISTAILFAVIFTLALIFRRAPNFPNEMATHWIEYTLVTACVFTIPLGMYWWTMKIIQAGISLPFFLLRKINDARKNGNT